MVEFPPAFEVARQADEAGEGRTILFNLSGHGHFDMGAYDNYVSGTLEDVAMAEERRSCLAPWGRAA
jgi:tryptophan synthase beta chain